MARPTEGMQEAADILDRAALELETALKHARTAAVHYRDADVLRGVAHAFAAQGHTANAGEHLDALARFHAERAEP